MRTKPKILIRKVNDNSYYSSKSYYTCLIDFFGDIDYGYDNDYDDYDDYNDESYDDYNYIEKEDEFGEYKKYCVPNSKEYIRNLKIDSILEDNISDIGYQLKKKLNI